MAFASLEACLDAIQTAAAVDSSIMFKPTKPPESPGDYPFLVTYPTSLRFEKGPAGAVTYLWDIVVELHIERSYLPEDTETVYPYAESVPDAVIGCLLENGTGSLKVGAGRFGFLGWGANEDDDNRPYPTIGFSWTFREVKIMKVLT